MGKYNFKHFNNEEELCSFLNELEKSSRSKEKYSGKHFNFKIITIYKQDNIITLIYEILEQI